MHTMLALIGILFGGSVAVGKLGTLAHSLYLSVFSYVLSIFFLCSGTNWRRHGTVLAMVLTLHATVRLSMGLPRAICSRWIGKHQKHHEGRGIEAFVLKHDCLLLNQKLLPEY